MSYYDDYYYGRNKRHIDWPYVLLIIVAVGFVAAIVGFVIYSGISHNIPEETYIVQVTDKQVKPHGKTSDNLVYTVVDDSQAFESSEETDGGKTAVFCVNDSFYRWRWNSADVFASIKIGEWYKIRTAGIRLPLFSWYPNILEVTPLTEQEAQKLLNEM